MPLAIASPGAPPRPQADRESLLAGALDAIVSVDAEGRITEFNPAAEAMFGHAAASVLGCDLTDVIVPQDSATPTAPDCSASSRAARSGCRPRPGLPPRPPRAGRLSVRFEPPGRRAARVAALPPMIACPAAADRAEPPCAQRLPRRPDAEPLDAQPLAFDRR